MSAYVRLFSNRLEFIEFKQNILFLKQPQHKASVFYDLKLEDFLKIRDFTNTIEQNILDGNKFTFNDYEKGLFELWSPLKAYPAASSLIAKVLMNEEIFNSLFQSYN